MRFFHKLTSVVFLFYFVFIAIIIFILGYVGTSAIKKSTQRKIEREKAGLTKLSKYEIIKETNILSNIIKSKTKKIHSKMIKKINADLSLLEQNKIYKIRKKIQYYDFQLILLNAFIMDKNFQIIRSYYPIKDNNFLKYLKKKNIKLSALRENYQFIMENNIYPIFFKKKNNRYYYLEYKNTKNLYKIINENAKLVFKENIHKNNIIFISDSNGKIFDRPILIGDIDSLKIHSILKILKNSKNSIRDLYSKAINDTLTIFIYKKKIEIPNITLYSSYIQNINVLKQKIFNYYLMRKKEIFKFHLILTLAFLAFSYFLTITLRRFKESKRAFDSFFRKAETLNNYIDIKKIHYEEFRGLAELINTKVKIINKIQNDLLERDKFLKSLENGLEVLFSIDDNEKAIKKFLKILSENLGLSLIMVITNDNKENYHLKYMWGKKEKDLKRLFEKIPKKLFDNLVDEFTEKNKKYVIYQRHKTTRPLLPKSVIFFPIYIENKFWGIFGTGKKEEKDMWSDVMKVTLSSFVKTLALYIVKSEKERDIKENENFLKLLLENLKSTVFLINDSGYFTFANKAITDLTGYSLKELENKKFYDIVSDAHKNMVKERGEKRLQKEKVISNYEFKIITKDGKEKWVEIANDYIELLGKKYILGTAYDVSDKYKTLLLEKTLTNITAATLRTDNVKDYILRIRSYLSQVVDISNFCFLLHKKNSLNIQIITYEDKYDDFSKTTELDEKSLTGYIIGMQKSLLLYKKDIIEMAKEGKIKIIGTLPEVWMGIPFNLDNEYNAVIIMQNYEKKDTYTEKELELMKIVINHIALAINRIKFLNKIKESEEKYRTLFENAHDSIFILDGEILVNCNYMATKLLKTDKAKIIGKSVLKFSPEYQDDNKKIKSEHFARKKLETVLKGKPLLFEWKIKDAFSNILICEVSLNRIKIGDNFFIMVILRDVTERKKMLADLKNSLAIMKIQNEEIFHRVMNNLQLFKSIFNLYSKFEESNQQTKQLLTFLKEKTQLISNILTDIYITPEERYLDLRKSFNSIVQKCNLSNKGINFKLISYRRIDATIKHIVASMLVLDQILNLIINRFREKSVLNPSLIIELQAKDNEFAEIVIYFTVDIAVKDIFDLGISKTEYLLFNLFIKQIEGKVEFSKNVEMNTIIFTFRYGNRGGNNG